MYRCQRWAPALLLFGLLAMQSSAADAESRIGVATSTRPNAEGVIGANSQTLSPGTELYANETVRTGNLGRADLVLLDNTNLTVGPTSEVLLDKFVYDRTGSSGSVVLQATRGAFRFVTGSQDHRAYQVNTPYGSLGVRGTTVEVVVKPKGQKKGLCLNGRPPEPEKPCEVECDVVYRLVEGKGATYTSCMRENVVSLTIVNDVVCITPSGDVVHSTSSESILSFEVAEVTTSPSPPPRRLALRLRLLHTHRELALPHRTSLCRPTTSAFGRWPPSELRLEAALRPGIGADCRLSTCNDKDFFLNACV